MFTALPPRLSGAPALLVEENVANPLAELVETARNAVSLVAWLIILAVVVALAVFVVRWILRGSSLKKIKGIHEEAMEKASRYEAKGDFASAGAMYEKLGDVPKAAELYERGKDFGRAARLQESLGRPEKAVEFYKRAGESLKAAEVYVKTGKYLDAAKIFHNKGDRLRAAQALEMAGNLLAAAKEYKAAGQPLRAARVYKDKGLYKEAGEMYLLSIGDEEPNPSNIDKYYTYAAFLMVAEEVEKAAEVYRGIVQIDSGYRDVTQRLAAIASMKEQSGASGKTAPAPPQDAGVEFVDMEAEGPAEQRVEQATAQAPDAPDDIDALIESELDRRDTGGQGARQEAGPAPKKGEATFRGIINSGSMEPSYSMRMWVQVLRKLSEEHGNGVFHGCLAPEAVFIDMQNNVRIEKPAGLVPAYTAPEVIEGLPPDEQADIYALGAMLYEMVTGSIDALAEKAPSALADDVPEWLEDLILRCTEKDRAHRYKSLEEIYSRLLELRDVM
jgi:tetratricopeptide (TPR) repeat protein